MGRQGREGGRLAGQVQRREVSGLPIVRQDRSLIPLSQRPSNGQLSDVGQGDSRRRRPARPSLGNGGTLDRRCLRLPYRFCCQPYDHGELDVFISRREDETDRSFAERRAELTAFLDDLQNMALSHSIAQFVDEDMRSALRAPVVARL